MSETRFIGYSRAMMYNKLFRLTKRWIMGNHEKQVIEESDDREEWTQAEEIIADKDKPEEK